VLGHIEVGEAAPLVFRSVRELLMNTVKHTDVKQATAYMTCTKSPAMIDAISKRAAPDLKDI
jgi:hypothetical protein